MPIKRKRKSRILHIKGVKNQPLQKIINPFTRCAFDDMRQDVDRDRIFPIRPRMKDQGQFSQCTHHIGQIAISCFYNLGIAIMRTDGAAQREIIRKPRLMGQKMFDGYQGCCGFDMPVVIDDLHRFKPRIKVLYRRVQSKHPALDQHHGKE